MKRILLRTIILFGIFTLSLIVFMTMFNSYDVTSTKSMSEATLPVLYIRQGDTSVNRMYGYTNEINETTFRESLTLLPSDKTLRVEINTYGNSVSEVVYQVSSLQDGSIVENGTIRNFSESEGGMTAEFSLNGSIGVNREYMLKFSVDCGGVSPVYYYTRIVQRSNVNLDPYLEYVEAFYQNCLSGNLTEEMVSQLETDASANSSLHYVNINSDKEQIAWGNLSPSLVKKAVPSIKEINETTVSIGLDYTISAASDTGGTEYYAVTEFYRMRKSQESVILLNYERTATQIFDGDLSVLTDDGLSLGVTGKDLAYTCSPSNDIVAFVQANELWQYDRSSNKLCKIFGFREDDMTDERAQNRSFDISVSSVSDEGNTTFMVYGYMAAGEHEGSLGIGAYRYYDETNTTSELMFIPLSDSFDYISEGLSKLAYVNSGDECFLWYDDTVYKIRLEDLSASVIHSDLDWEAVCVSSSQKFAAWLEGNDVLSDTLYELNLETGEASIFSADDGEYIKPLGFVNEDLVYGLAYAEDCSDADSASELFPMYKIVIVNPDGDTVKTYRVSNFYVTGATIDENVINLSRAFYNGEGKLQSTSDDQIISYSAEGETYVKLTLDVSERNGTHVNLEFSSGVESSNPLNMTARYPADLSDDLLEIPGMTYSQKGYRVYAFGRLYGIYESINSAIISADENVGVVLDENQSYVWERGNVKTAVLIEPDDLPSGLLSAPINEENIASALGDEYEVWNLTGCSLSALRYQLSSGYAVTAQYTEDETILILGYDQYNIRVYDEKTQLVYAIGMEDAENAFSKCGSVFMSYREIS